MGYESLHITELLSVQCLQVDDVIPICRLAENHNLNTLYTLIKKWCHQVNL